MEEGKVKRTYIVDKMIDQQLGIEAIKKEIDKSVLLDKILKEYFLRKK